MNEDEKKEEGREEGGGRRELITLSTEGVAGAAELPQVAEEGSR